MRYLASLFIVLILYGTSFAGYPANQFTSLHQPSGFKNKCIPGAVSCRTMTTSYIKLIKMYIPAGTKGISLIAHVGQAANSSYAVIARLGQPPTITSISNTVGLPNDGFRLSDLSSDCIGKNSSGYLFIVKDSGIKTTIGQWVYAQIIIFSGNVIDISSTNQFDQTIYKDWYDTAQWQANGDPIEVGMPVPTVKPTPTPVVTPITSPTPVPTPIVIHIIKGQTYTFTWE